MIRRYAFLLSMLLLGVLVTSTAAQSPSPSATPIDPNANITWPPPVYVLRGEVELRGSADLPNMSNYFIEFRPLADDLSVPNENAPWFPATLPAQTPVQNGVLGTWNTATAPDGVYEVRLTINVSGSSPVFFLVSPLRIENNPPPWVNVAITTPTPFVIPTVTQPPVRPTLAPTPTAPDTTPRVTAVVDANVRKGDSTSYERIDALLTGQTAQVIGLSSFGTGWYYIQLPDGRRGWIAPSVVRAEGDFSRVPYINPPPLPTPVATATPFPTATPVTNANLVITNVTLDPNPPVCNQTFTVYVTVLNSGTTATSSSGTISVVDRHVASGTQAGATSGGFPVLQPGQSFQGVIPLTVSIFYNEPHSLTITLDPSNQIPETNKADNTWVQTYTLQKGACP